MGPCQRIAAVGGLVLVGTLAAAPNARAQATGSAPAVKDYKVVSLHRPTEEWAVQTTVCLEAEDVDSKKILFTIVGGGAVLGSVACRPGCGLDPTPDGEDVRSARCVYQPHPGKTGQDSFQFVATDEQGLRSQPGKVEIDVRDEGLRWELLTNGSSGLSSDAASPSQLPKLLGATTEDFLFALNWQAISPAQKDKSTTTLTLQPSAADLLAHRLAPAAKTTGKMNLLFRVGWLSDPVAVQAVPVGTTIVTDPEQTAATQRHFTADGQLNGGWVIKADSRGTYVELGVGAKGAVDAYAESGDLARRENGSVVQLLRQNSTFFRMEAGGRFALKQFKENPSSVVIKGNDVIHPANLDDLVTVEFMLQRNNGMAGLEAGGGDSRNRFSLRVAAQPQLANVPGRPKGLIGVEVTRALGGGPYATKVFYGMNLSGNKLF